MSRVEGTRNRIDEQEGNAKAEEIAALNRFLVTATVLVSLKLDGRVEGVADGACMSSWDGESVRAVDEQAGVTRLEDRRWWMGSDEVLVELYVE